MACAGREWLAVLKYGMVAVQGSAAAQANLAWLLQRSSGYNKQHRLQMCMRLLTQAGPGGVPDAWVDGGNLEHDQDRHGIWHPSAWLYVEHTVVAACGMYCHGCMCQYGTCHPGCICHT